MFPNDVVSVPLILFVQVLKYHVMSREEQVCMIVDAFHILPVDSSSSLKISNILHKKLLGEVRILIEGLYYICSGYV